MKSANIPILVIAGLMLSAVCAEERATNREINVTAERLYPGWYAGEAGSAADALEGLPGVRVDSQGGRSGQNDLAIRDSSFSGAGLALNGLALRNPQTEHFNAELPIPARLFASPTVLTGLDQARGSDGHLVGTVDMEFLPLRERRWGEAGMGEGGRDWQNVIVEQPLATGPEHRTGIAVFGAREVADETDNADNSLDRLQGGVHAQRIGERSQGDAVAAFQRKEFGARGYYGAPQAWDAEERIDDGLAYVGQRWGAPDERFVRAGALWRATEDRYELFWDLPGRYVNRHRTDVGAAMLDGRETFGGQTALRWRIGGESEALDSDRLGQHHRERGALSLLPEVDWGRAKLTAGANGQVFSEEKPAVLPQGGLSYALPARHVVFASYSETVRQPSYTELNYESPTSLGRLGLPRQSHRAGEIGWKWSRQDEVVSCGLSGFRGQSRHTVDWIKALSSSPRWEAADIGRVDTEGVEWTGAIRFGERFALESSYVWQHRDSEQEPYAGRYVLDYPEHFVQLAAEMRATKTLRGILTQSLRGQEDMGLRDDDRFGANGRLAICMTPVRIDGLELTLACDNLWNDSFEVYPGEPTSGRLFSASIAYAWK